MKPGKQPPDKHWEEWLPVSLIIPGSGDVITYSVPVSV